MTVASNVDQAVVVDLIYAQNSRCNQKNRKLNPGTGITEIPILPFCDTLAFVASAKIVNGKSCGSLNVIAGLNEFTISNVGTDGCSVTIIYPANTVSP